MKEITYTQCKFQKGDAFFTDFIPTKFAVLGKVFKFKHLDALPNSAVDLWPPCGVTVHNKWDDGWRVIQIYKSSTRLEPPDYFKVS